MEIKIRKVKNVRKTLVFMFLIFGVQILIGQEIKGIYYNQNNTDFEYEYLNFKDRRQFTYHAGGHFGGDIVVAKGQFEVEDSLIKLSFFEPQLKKSSYYYNFQSETEDDSIKVQIEIVDFNMGVAKNVKLNLLDDNRIFYTNNSGKYSFKREKGEDISFGKTSYLGFQDCYFTIDNSKNNLIKIYLAHDFYKPIEKMSSQFYIKDSNTIIEKKRKNVWTNN